MEIELPKLVDEYIAAVTSPEIDDQYVLALRKEVLTSLNHADDPFATFLHIAMSVTMLGGITMSKEMYDILVDYAYMRLVPTESNKRAMINILLYGKHKYGYLYVNATINSEREYGILSLLEKIPPTATFRKSTCIMLGDGAFGELFKI